MIRIFLLLIIASGFIACNDQQHLEDANKMNKVVNESQRAFPGAEGYGAFAKGGRGGDVYQVTNLNDNGPGSLRYGIESADGPRTIVFHTSGTIELKSDLTINKPYLTIAGQTAPADGITLKDRTLAINNTHDIVIRYIRIRYGDENKDKSALSDPDAIRTNGITDVIFDHISASWGIDGIHDLRGGNFTLQWSIYGESLNRSLHEDNLDHAMLASFRDLDNNVSVHHNLFHSSRERHPTLGGGVATDSTRVVDLRNNLIYNWKAPTNFGNCNVNVVNNYYKPGESTDLSLKPMQVKSEFAPTRAHGYVFGNLFPWNEEWTNDNYSAIEYTNWGKYKNTTRGKFELSSELVEGEFMPTTQTAQEAYESVLLYAGASKSRDKVDQRILEGVIDGSNRLIDSQNQVGGWPDLKQGVALKDSDNDGMPDYWEMMRGLEPNNPEDRNDDYNGDGYTNLEKYLNEMAMPSSDLIAQSL
ncbi:pectate lyase family protein [Cyclobacterium qasimii]|uniref:Pectate lyase n=2 Tax=Cyclobacterium qasimii TaxID=1350429 RepID=S7WHR9_9BACT|nr:pectate lyase [Cyclobacterium qasimii]EPR66264.1 Pectate lyase [Cyclobacterium qasimii M12-11B]GEO20798.1 pectate lyase [Cyclobacterium qasimii]